MSKSHSDYLILVAETLLVEYLDPLGNLSPEPPIY